MVKTLKEAAEIIQYKELLKNLVLRDIKVRYKRSVLGFVWVMLNPLLMMLVLYVVFSGIFKISSQNYVAYLLSGIILWSFFSQSTSTALQSLIGNSSLIKEVYVPKAIFPLSVVMSAAVNFIFSLIPLFLILFITKTPVGSHLYLLPVTFALVTLFSFGVALIVSTLAVFFHDTIHIYDVLLLIWMYMTPIIYPESIVPEKFRVVIQMNPFYYLLNLFRASIYVENALTARDFFYGAACAMLTVCIGWCFYNRHKNRIVFYL